MRHGDGINSAKLESGRVTIEEGVPFGYGGEVELLCDVYRPPEGVGNGTGILWLYGGGWAAGARDQLKGYGILLGRQGYLSVCAEYRLRPIPNNPADAEAIARLRSDERLRSAAPWPAQLDDVKLAVRWMHAHAADLGIEPDRIAVAGVSAGGHLALMAAATLSPAGVRSAVTTSDHVAAVIALYSPVDLTMTDPSRDEEHFSEGLAATLLGDGASEDERRNTSPISYVRSNFPPVLLMHGNHDRTVPGSNTASVSHMSSVRCTRRLKRPAPRQSCTSSRAEGTPSTRNRITDGSAPRRSTCS